MRNLKNVPFAGDFLILQFLDTVHVCASSCKTFQARSKTSVVAWRQKITILSSVEFIGGMEDHKGHWNCNRAFL